LKPRRKIKLENLSLMMRVALLWNSIISQNEAYYPAMSLKRSKSKSPPKSLR
jgi:hypothetical protein